MKRTTTDTNNGHLTKKCRTAKKEYNAKEETSSSIALLKAIDNGSIVEVQDILNRAYSYNILTNIVEDDVIKQCSPLSCALSFYKEGDDIPEITKKFLQVSKSGTKKDLEGPEFLRIRGAATITGFLQGDYIYPYDNFKYLKKHYLNKVYTSRSIEALEKTFDISIDFDPNEYMKAYEQNLKECGQQHIQL